jgi:hypothetical protein
MTKFMLAVGAAFMVMSPVHAEIPTPNPPSCNTAAFKTTTVVELGLWLPLELVLSVLGGMLGLSGFLRAASRHRDDVGFSDPSRCPESGDPLSTPAASAPLKVGTPDRRTELAPGRGQESESSPDGLVSSDPPG